MAPPSILIMLSWCYCMVSLGSHYKAMAKPIEAPDVLKCETPKLFPPMNATNCCPPKSMKIIDFTPPPPSQTLRMRPAAHLVDDNYIRKYENATKMMKSLDPSHPWYFIEQANVHCAYCDGAYNQTSFPNVTLQVHGSWLFLPFHRAYLYFYERILGKLIDDDTFALPFWNWDAPDGMTIPALYANPNSTLYDDSRDPLHQPPNIIQFDFSDSENRSQIIEDNLKLMYTQMVTGGKTAELFLGSPYRAGDYPYPGAGSLEMSPHGPVHVWTGGNVSSFPTAGRDAIFYAHHANVDRMWEVWKDLPGGNRNNFNDTDFLDAAFIFWDENKQLVRIKVRDVVDTRRLGYVYQDVPLPWINATSIRRELEKPMTSRMLEFPLSLDGPVSVQVKRPERVRSSIEDREEEEEVLVVDGIELEHGVHARFDVYASTAKEEDGANTTMFGTFAGSFVHLPMGKWRGGRNGAKMMRTRLKLGLTGVLKELRAMGDGSIVVTMIPRTQNAKIKVTTVSIEVSP